MKTGAALFLAAIAFLACATLTTSVDYDRSLDFSRYRSFELIVDLVDAERTCLVWRGRATDTVSSDSEARDRQLREAVARMFEDFPPRPGAR